MSGNGEVENATVGEHMLIVGNAITASFEGCAVVKPVSCSVPATITTRSMKSEIVTTTDKQKYVPTEGTTFVTFSVGGGAECSAALKGSKSVTGSATAVDNEATGEQEFTSTSGSELKFAGQNATVTGKSTFDTQDGTPLVARTDVGEKEKEEEETGCR